MYIFVEATSLNEQTGIVRKWRVDECGNNIRNILMGFDKYKLLNIVYKNHEKL